MPVERRRARPAATVARHTQATRGRRLLSVALWTVVAVGTLVYATSLAVPLWFQLHDQRLLIVTSGSMEPAFSAGDAVVMQSVTDASQLKVGQVVSFWPLGSEQLVTHRIVDLKTLPTMEQRPDGTMQPVDDPTTGEPATGRFIITQGDANPEPDVNATPFTRVRGIVLGVHEGWGWALQWSTSAAGRATMLIPPLLALGTLELLAVRDARRRAKPSPTPEERHVDAYLLEG